MTMGTRIVVMKDGFIQQVDTPQNLYDSPCNEFVAGFIGSPQMNFADATVVKSGNGLALKFDAYEIPLPADKSKGLEAYVGKEVTFGIRPEHVHDEPDFLAKVDPKTIITANVDVTELMGAEIYLYLNINGAPITARVDPASTAKPGDNIKVAFDLSKIHVFDKETEQTITN
jgi:multiple sugar transport system ATP-binding protein